MSRFSKGAAKPDNTKEAKTLLVVGQDCDPVQALLKSIEAPTIKTQSIKNGYDALNYVQLNSVDGIIVCDQLELISPIDTIKRLLAHPHKIPIWLWVTRPTIQSLYEFLLAGCDRWLLSNSSEDVLRQLIVSGLNQFGFFPEVDQKRFQLYKKYGINNLVGSSSSMMELYFALEKTINTEISVLIQGESGSGKELVARLIHFMSSRANEKLVSLNCAAVPNNLMESELFGFEKGAFTGANVHKQGKFEYAHKGTLFLDEIADMDMLMQSKILRVLELREFERIGSNDPRKADVRIISASNKELGQYIKENRFRMDLYYRINGFTLEMPPLRKRYGDFLPLMVYFIYQSNKKNRRQIQTFDMDILSVLHDYFWPGNVRELESFLVRAVLFSDGTHLNVNTVVNLMEPMKKSDLYQYKSDTIAEKQSTSTMEEMEKTAIINALTEVSGNVTAAAKKLGVSRVTVWRKMERYNIKYEGPRA